MSKGEQAVMQILTDAKIEFRQEVTLLGLTNEVGTELPVDFVIKVGKKLAIIEYNGQQHYQQIMGQIEAFNCRVRNDTTRITYATKMGIPLLIIHYKDLPKVAPLIKLFVGDVKSNCKKKRQYSPLTFGYFEKNQPTNAPKTTDVFALTTALHEPVVAADVKTPYQLTQNAEFGFVQVGSSKSGAIIWTIEQMNHFTTNLKQEKSQMAAIKLENKELIAKLSMSTSQLLNLSKQHASLQVKVGNLEEENEKLHAEVTQLKQQLKQNVSQNLAVVLTKGKVIKQEIPFPAVIRKPNKTFTKEFRKYMEHLQQKYQFTLAELREYLEYFDVVVSDATLRKIVA